MIQMNVHQAKTNFSKLLDAVEQGEDVVIARNGKPVARLVPHEPRRNYRSIVGVWKGQVDMSRFDEADEEIARELGMLD
jgi:prevent-host-death family protein